MDDRSRHCVLLLCGLTLACAAALPGCKAVRKWFFPSDQIELGTVETLEEGESLERQGLGIQLLVVDDTGYDAPRALRAYPPIGDEAVALSWARWGFRVVQVPVEEVNPILASLRTVQPVSDQFLGEFSGWRPLVRSGAIQAQRVTVGSGIQQVSAGRPRLIARSWTEPVLIDRGVQRQLRVDLGIQIESPPSNAFELIPEHREPTLDDAGDVIDDLLSTLHLDGSHAIFIVGEAPGEDWADLPSPEALSQIGSSDPSIGPSPEDESTSEPRGETETVRPARPTEPAFEPSVPRLRSLGELMLVAPGSRVVRANQTRAIPKRVVIVLIPELLDDQRTRTTPEYLDGEAS
jgi:hypothetical protein